MELGKPLDGYEAVVAWAESLRRQWGGDPLVEDPDKLETLAAFCESVGKDPDELVAFCFLRRKESGERFTSQKRRAEVVSKLDDFAAASGLTGTAARRLKSNVVSFLTHNGVLM